MKPIPVEIDSLKPYITVPLEISKEVGENVEEAMDESGDGDLPETDLAMKTMKVDDRPQENIEPANLTAEKKDKHVVREEAVYDDKKDDMETDNADRAEDITKRLQFS